MNDPSRTNGDHTRLVSKDSANSSPTQESNEWRNWRHGPRSLEGRCTRPSSNDPVQRGSLSRAARGFPSSCAIDGVLRCCELKLEDERTGRLPKFILISVPTSRYSPPYPLV